MTWAESERLLNTSVQQMYAEEAHLLPSGRPLCGVFNEPFQVRESDDAYGVENDTPQPEFIIPDAAMRTDIEAGVQIDLRQRRFTIVDVMPEPYGTSKLLLQEYRR